MKLIEWKFGKKQQRWNWYPVVDGAPDLAAPVEPGKAIVPDPHGGPHERKEWLRLNHPDAYAAMYDAPKPGAAELAVAGDQLELETPEAHRARIVAAAQAAGQEDDW